MRAGPAILAALAASLILAGCQTTGSTSGAGDKFVRVNTESLPTQASASAQADSPLAQALLDEVNAFRTSKGVAPLARDPRLQKAAAVHSEDMALRNFFGHFNPDDQGPKERVLAIDKEYKGALAENIAYVQGSKLDDRALAKKLFTKWRNSPAHRRNMQDPTFTITGMGVSRSGDKVYATEVFGGS